MGKTAVKIAGFFFFLVAHTISWGNSSQVSPETVFGKLKNFIGTLPPSFVAQVSSKGIRADIQKIPKIYIKDSTKPPRLLLYFSHQWGVKIWMDNVAKGISKQYTAISEGFKSFFPFLRAQSFEEFHKKFRIEASSYSNIKVFDGMNTEKIFYIFQIDAKSGKISSVKESINGKTAAIIRFSYDKKDGYTVISRLHIDRFLKPVGQYRFQIGSYDVHANLMKEDFLG